MHTRARLKSKKRSDSDKTQDTTFPYGYQSITELHPSGLGEYSKNKVSENVCSTAAPRAAGADRPANGTEQAQQQHTSIR